MKRLCGAMITAAMALILGGCATSNVSTKTIKTDLSSTQFHKIVDRIDEKSALGQQLRSVKYSVAAYTTDDGFLVRYSTVCGPDKDEGYLGAAFVFDSQTELMFMTIPEKKYTTTSCGTADIAVWPGINAGQLVMIKTMPLLYPSHPVYLRLIMDNGKILSEYYKVKDDDIKSSEIHKELKKIEIPPILQHEIAMGEVSVRPNYSSLTEPIVKIGLGERLDGEYVNSVLAKIPELKLDKYKAAPLSANGYDNTIGGLIEIAKKFRSPDLQKALADAIKLQGHPSHIQRNKGGY
ncbi:hypothetical protein [Geobacter sp.]|uniref:hypothetical protein n=1 Tax=Geobacter sp. TaxID=46610 RepID=UPI0027BA6EE0|nr:hypothetical protein [Geobacter sp.]